MSPALAAPEPRRAPPTVPQRVALARIRLARVPRAVALDGFSAASRELASLGGPPRDMSPPRA